MGGVDVDVEALRGLRDPEPVELDELEDRPPRRAKRGEESANELRRLNPLYVGLRALSLDLAPPRHELELRAALEELEPTRLPSLAPSAIAHDPAGLVVEPGSHRRPPVVLPQASEDDQEHVMDNIGELSLGDAEMPGDPPDIVRVLTIDLGEPRGRGRSPGPRGRPPPIPRQALRSQHGSRRSKPGHALSRAIRRRDVARRPLVGGRDRAESGA